MVKVDKGRGERIKGFKVGARGLPQPQMPPDGDRYSDSNFDATDRRSGLERSTQICALHFIIHPRTDPGQRPPSRRHDHLRRISQHEELGGNGFYRGSCQGEGLRCCQLSLVSAWAMESDGSGPAVCYSADK